MLNGLTSFEDVIQRAAAYRADGQRPKTVVRFYDQRGVVTSLVKKYFEKKTKNHELVDILFERIAAKKRFGNNWREYRLRRILRKMRVLQDEALLQAKVDARTAIETNQPVGFEVYPGAPFRYLLDNEKHELMERITVAKGAWLFVFEPNDLLADTNKSVGAMT
jgi:hypothetical protein